MDAKPAEAELQGLATAIPAVRRRVALEQRVAQARRDRAALDAVLDAIGVPAFLMNGGAIEQTNAAGSKALERDVRATMESLRGALGGGSGYRVLSLDASGASGHHLVVADGALEQLRVRVARVANRVALSARQREVLELLMQGYANRTISALLDVAEHTVELHVLAVFKATGTFSRTELMARIWTEPW